MPNVQDNLRLIWADKIALTMAVLVVAMTALAWVFVALAAGLMGANHVLASIGAQGAVEIAAILLAIWATFRAIDFVFHGSTYRLFHAAHADVVALPAGGNLLAH